MMLGLSTRCSRGRAAALAGARRALSSHVSSAAPCPTSEPILDTWWSDVCAPHEDLRLRVTSDGSSVTRRSPAPAAALAGPAALKQGAHEITLAIRGEGLVVGVAEADVVPSMSAWPWRHRAWGLASWSRELVSCPTALEAPADRVDLPVPAITEEEVTLQLRIDTIRGRVLFVRNGERRGVTRVANGVLRPWALFLPRGGIEAAAADVSAEGVRLVAHSYRQVPTFNVSGLTPLVGELPITKQALALAWCEGRGVEALNQLTHDGCRALVDALRLPAEHARELMQRLEAQSEM